jgi:opacity protein-like surface antigen
MAWGRSFLLGGACAVALLALGQPGLGKDGPRARVPKAPSVPYSDWTGLYLGINAGYGFGTSQTDAFFGNGTVGSPSFAAGASSKLDGALGGAQAGYNWQSGIWLIGLETEIAATTQRATQAYFCPATSCNPTLAGFDATVGIWQYQKLEWFSTLRGRLGVTVTPDALVYATGGAAIAGISHVGTNVGSNLTPLLDANGNPINTTAVAGTGFLTHTTKTGWAAGAGVEVRLAGNWTGKIEYLHLDFGRDAIDASNLQNATPLVVSLNSHVSRTTSCDSASTTSLIPVEPRRPST